MDERTIKEISDGIKVATHLWLESEQLKSRDPQGANQFRKFSVNRLQRLEGLPMSADTKRLVHVLMEAMNEK